MVQNTLGTRANNYLALAISVLTILLAIGMIWQMNLISGQNEEIAKQEGRLAELLEKYVMLERYGCDQASLASLITSIKKDLREDIKALGDKLDDSIYRPYSSLNLEREYKP